MDPTSRRAPRLMTALPSPNDDLRRFSDVLEDLGDAPGDKLSLEELVAAFGERGFGAMILILSLLALLPWPPGGKQACGRPFRSPAAMPARQRAWPNTWHWRRAMGLLISSRLCCRPR